MANIQWKSWIETYNDPELNINLLKAGKLLPGKRYSFYSLATTTGPTDPNKHFQKITGTFNSLNLDKEGEAIFVDCVDENDNPLIGERTGFVKFKLEGSDTMSTNEEGNEMTHLDLASKPREDDYSDTRPYNRGGTKKRRRCGKQKTKQRRKLTRRRNLNRKRKSKR
jgi:hypothetical protein